MKPICVPCRRFFRCKKNSYDFIEAMPLGDRAVPGAAHPEQWTPYKVWSGDLYECEGCGAQIVSGVASQPLAEHYHTEFNEIVKRLGADQLQVNDC